MIMLDKYLFEVSLALLSFFVGVKVALLCAKRACAGKVKVSAVMRRVNKVRRIK